MRVLWLVRRNLERHPGGDTTQILQTRAALERNGVRIELAHDAPEHLTAIDGVHHFPLDRLREHLPVCRRLRAAGVPAVLSTIYWPADEFDREGRRGLQGVLARTLGSHRHQTLRLLQRFGLDAWQSRSLRRFDVRLFSIRRAARCLLETVAAILPNSVAERDAIQETFGVQTRAVVTPNAVDAEAFAAPTVPWERRVGVLCVGRLEPRKNQLALIRALRDTSIPLTVVGRAGRFNRRYARSCRAAAGPYVRFIDWQSPAELRALYAAVRVHACVSWYETPGLASLEAGLCGCNLVVTPGGATREYFGEQAEYSDPRDPDSIRQAVERALARAPSEQLADRIRNEFNWDATARATVRGYELALATRRAD